MKNRTCFYGMLLLVLLLFAACQSTNATPTLLPGETEIPFTTVVLDENGVIALEQDSALRVITNKDGVAELQPLISTTAFQQVQAVDFNTYSLIALFRVPGSGCAMFGVTIERLVRKANTLTVYAYDWRPPHVCAETNMSAYHIAKVRKADANLAALTLTLQRQRIERTK